MAQPFFADAEASFDEASFILYGYPNERTACFRKGTAQAPAEIRRNSENFETFLMELGVDLTHIAINDIGDVGTDGKPEDQRREISELTSRITKAGKVPIGIGGEHSLTPSAVEGTMDRYKDLGVLVLDAHLDFRDGYQGHAYSHASVTRRLTDILGHENVVVMGVRSASKAELSLARQKGLRFVESNQMAATDIRDTMADILEWIQTDHLYVSLDMDVIDPGFAPGVGTPEPFGITPYEVIQTLNYVSDMVVGFDCVEVCPPHDNGNTSALAARLIRHAMGSIWQSHGGRSWKQIAME